MTNPPASAPIGRGRPGPVRKATREALEAANLPGVFAVQAILAERYAELVDRASVSGDAPGLLRAGDKLREILAGLPLVAEGVSPIEPDHGEDEGARLRLVMDSPPTVGNP